MRKNDMPVGGKLGAQSYRIIPYKGEKVKIPLVYEKYFNPQSSATATGSATPTPIVQQALPAVKEVVPKVTTPSDEAPLVLNFSGAVSQIAVQYTNGTRRTNVCEMTANDAETAKWVAENHPPA